MEGSLQQPHRVCPSAQKIAILLHIFKFFCHPIFKNKIRSTMHLPHGGRVYSLKFENWSWYYSLFLGMDYFENIWSDMQSDVHCLSFITHLVILWKSHVYMIFYVKNQFLHVFYTQNDILQFSRACSHDVIVRPYTFIGWYLICYHWKEGAHSYTLAANLGFYDFSVLVYQIWKGWQPLLQKSFGRKLRRTMVKGILTDFK